MEDASCVFFFFQAEDGMRDSSVSGVQTCALPILCVCMSVCVYAYECVCAYAYECVCVCVYECVCVCMCVCVRRVWCVFSLPCGGSRPSAGHSGSSPSHGPIGRTGSEAPPRPPSQPITGQTQRSSANPVRALLH